MVKRISIALVDAAVRVGRAELLGSRIGDPVYMAGGFWQIAEDGNSFEFVVDPVQVVVCAGILRRLRAARATRTST